MKQLFVVLSLLTAITFSFSFAQTNGNSNETNQVSTATDYDAFFAQFCPPGCCKPAISCKPNSQSTSETVEVVSTESETKTETTVVQASFAPPLPFACCSATTTSCKTSKSDK